MYSKPSTGIFSIFKNSKLQRFIKKSPLSVTNYRGEVINPSARIIGYLFGNTPRKETQKEVSKLVNDFTRYMVDSDNPSRVDLYNVKKLIIDELERIPIDKGPVSAKNNRKGQTANVSRLRKYAIKLVSATRL